MTSDQLGWLALIIFVACIVVAVMELTTLAWILALVGIALIVYAKMKS